jgi:hypothetical protein
MSFDQLDTDKVFSQRSQTKDTMNIGVYRGSSSISIWSEGSNAPSKIPLAPSTRIVFKKYLQGALANKQPSVKNSFLVEKYDITQKKSIGSGTVVIGRSDSGVIYIGVQIPGRAAIKFELRTPIGIDLPDPLNDVSKSELQCEVLIEALEIKLPVLEVITKSKMDRNGPPGAGGNRRPGSGFGGGNGGGGGQQQTDDPF